MTGLEKITDRILADARADAEATEKTAAEKIAGIRAAGQAEADAIADRERERLEKDCEDMILRARSTAEMTRRDLLLEKRASLVDEAFDRAMREIAEMDREKYKDLLVSLLCTALAAQYASEEESMRLYGEDIRPEEYEVKLNKRDRDACGKDLVALACRRAAGKNYCGLFDRVRVSEKTAPIDGGLILLCGDIETNCSFSMILAGLREELEPQVAKILFRDLPT